MGSEDVSSFPCFAWWGGEGLYTARSASGHDSFHWIQCWQNWSFSAQQSEKHSYSVQCLGWFVFLAAQKLSEVRMKWQKIYVLCSVHRLDFHSLSAASICASCVHQEIPTSDDLFASNSQTEGKFITYNPMYSNLFTSNINYLNTVLPTACSVMPHASSASPF